MNEKFLNKLNNLYEPAEVNKILKAFNFAKEKHEGQKRESGEDFIIHPLSVAEILVDSKADAETVACGFLHDCLEMTDTTEKEIRNNFGDNIHDVLVGLARIEDVKRAYFMHGEESENLRKMLLALGSDARIAYIKLSERLHNMQTLHFKLEEKQLKTAQETLDLYVPLAERLGMNIFKREMEDLCFKYSKPREYLEVRNYINEYYERTENLVVEISNIIKDVAKRHNIEARVQSRKKSCHSVYTKWNKKGRDKVFDIIAHRIIVKTVQDCYTMLGAIHDIWTPVEGRIKDYISQPKPNLYMSLHTTVLLKTDKGEVPFEIQIRTEEMHNYCEYGIAAHWIYKEKGVKALNVSKDKLRKELIKDSLEITVKENTENYLDNIKKGFYSDRIFVFSPNYNVIELPIESTPIDFAYSIHSNLGNKCVGARVNKKMVPLSTTLKTGDIVEVITSTSSKGPSREWLNIVKSREAKSKIRAFFKKERREENIKLGKEILEEFAKKNGHNLNVLLSDETIVKELIDKYVSESIDEIYAIVGNGGLTANQILSKYVVKQKDTEKKNKKVKKSSNSDNIKIGGHLDLLKKFAKCCNPVPGDDIVGYVSRGKGVTIHRKDCPYLNHLEQDRIIETEWSMENLDGVYDASFKVVAKNASGVLNVISNKITENKIDVVFIGFDKANKSGDAILNVGVKIKNRKQLVEIINKLRAMNEVYDVYR